MATTRLCSIPDCGKPLLAKGCCAAHYYRLTKHGDPLGGRTPPGEPLRFVNEVAMTHATNECLLWPFAKKGAGYGTIWIDGRLVGTHRYICERVHGAPPTPDHDAAHSCGHEGCVNPHHLEWKTAAENMADKLIHGTHHRGERNPQAKLTEAEAREIISLKGLESKVALAERFGVSTGTIGDIHRGRNWSWLIDATTDQP
ncbi:hypothetical protein HJB79_31670 [Rhizobium lentis]|uniref:HNH endonuclease n=1 Tax=Rhizobium lentis TaxID=1138194 RepID=UPI001C829B32|nr:HNH endonuclease [Rhizobium lentis]MBX5143268.1 hypothetical protein [Rhizobium lentis]